jgi:hypothetical protein
VEIGEKCGQPPAALVHQDMATFNVWLQFVPNPLRKTTYGFCKN